jgi:hypothetical protein
MYLCKYCSKEFALKFIYDLHFTKCQNEGEKLGENLDVIEVREGEVVDEKESYIEKKIKELENRIVFLEKKPRICDLPVPTNDYMRWVRSLLIKETDKVDAFNEGSFVIIRRILKRNRIENSGVFCILSSKTGKNRLLLGRKILGVNRVILGYCWDYVKMQDYIEIVEYFCDIFKGKFIEWCNGGGGDEYEKYYNNVMLINENIIVRQLREFIMSMFSMTK